MARAAVLSTPSSLPCAWVEQNGRGIQGAAHLGEVVDVMNRTGHLGHGAFMELVDAGGRAAGGGHGGGDLGGERGRQRRVEGGRSCQGFSFRHIAL